MTLSEFRLLSDEKQYEITFMQGDFIDYYLQGNLRYSLYAVNRLFVEIEYDRKKNKIMNLVSFIEGEKLDRYAN